MLRAKATAMYEAMVAESNIELQIDLVETVPEAVHCGLYLEQDTTPAEVTATILERGEMSERMEKGLMSCNNIPFDPCIAHLNWLFEQRSKVKVWIYNISRQVHVLGNGLIKKLHVPACDNEKYAVVTSLPAVMITSKENVDTGELDYLITDGRRTAMDLINPSNLGIDQDSKIVPYLSIGTDFSNKGVFFSTHNPPLKKELKAAHKRLKAYYERLAERVSVIAAFREAVRLAPVAKELCVTVPDITAAQNYLKDYVPKTQETQQ